MTATQDAARSGSLPPQGLVLLLLLSLAWGCNWPIMKIALAEIPLLTFRAICLGGGAIGLFAIAHVSGVRLRPSRRELLHLIPSALCNVTGWNLLSAYGLLHLPAGRAAMLAYTMPLWSVLLGSLVLRERFDLRRGFGLALGAAGLAVLLANEATMLRAAPVAALAMVGAALVWACGTICIKRFPVSLPTTSFTAWQMLIGGAPVFLLAIPAGIPDHMSHAAIGAALYNVFASFIFAYWAWFKIVGMVPVAVSGIATLLVPVIGMASGMVMLREQPGMVELVALALIIAALATVIVPRGFGRAAQRASSIGTSR